MDLQRLLPVLRGRRRRSEAGPIGLDLDAEMLHMLQLERHRGETRIRAALSVAYPGDRQSLLNSPRELKALLHAALESRPFRGPRVVTAMPSAELKLMVLNYSLRAGETDPEVILRLVQERIDQTSEECVVDYLSIRTSGYERGERSALVAVARRGAVIRHLERLRTAGFEVQALEIAPVSVHRLITRLAHGSAAENSLVLHCGSRQSDLTVLLGRRLILYREIDFGVDQVVEQLGKSLDVDPESAVSMLQRYGVFPDESGGAAREDPAREREISQTIMEISKASFYSLAEQVGKAVIYTASQSRGASVGQVYLIGNLARWPGAERLLHSLLAIPVRIPDPLASFPLAGESAMLSEPDPGGAIAVATGLALRGIGDEQ